MRVFGPQHTATINGVMSTTSVSPLIMGTTVSANLNYFPPQLVNSIISMLYIALALENVGYMWTFIIFSLITTSGEFTYEPYALYEIPKLRLPFH